MNPPRYFTAIVAAGYLRYEPDGYHTGEVNAEVTLSPGDGDAYRLELTAIGSLGTAAIDLDPPAAEARPDQHAAAANLHAKPGNQDAG